MRILFIGIILLFQLSALAQSDFNSIQSVSSGGTTDDLSAFKGRRTVLLVAIDSLQTQDDFVAFVDSLQTSYPDVAFILQPVNDSTTLYPDSVSQKKAKKPLLKQVKLEKVSKVAKKFGQDRATLVQWLMDGKKNGHFESSLSVGWQLYVINESGVLYAVLDAGVSTTVIQEVLRQEDFKENIN